MTQLDPQLGTVEAGALSVSFRPGTRLAWRQQLAGLELLSDQPMAELDSTALHGPVLAAPADQPRAGRRVFCDPAWVAGSQLQLAAWWSGECCWIELEDKASFALDRSTGQVRVVDSAPDLETRWLEHALLGPPLLVLLASQGCFALHASAIDFGGQLVLFVGPSGAGKSTLAAAARDQDTPPEDAQKGTKRWADDLVPIRLVGDRVVASEGYPQLKLPAEQRSAHRSPPHRPVVAVFVLEPALPTDSPKCDLHQGLAATTAWLSHTMATRLFDPTLLESHLDFVTAASRLVPTYQLRVPRDHQRLPQVLDLLRRTVEA